MPDPSARTSPLLYVLLGCSLTLNVVLLFSGRSGEAPVAPERPVAAGSGDSGAPALAQQPGAAAETLASAPLDAASEVAPDGGWTTLGGKVEHSLARTFQQLAAEDGDALSGQTPGSAQDATARSASALARAAVSRLGTGAT